MIKLALTDLDDTLINFGTPRATYRSRAAIHAFLDRGLHFGPVTGRLPADMTWMFEGDKACYATGAFANGQIVCVDGSIVHMVTIDGTYLETVEQVLDATDGEGYLALYHPWVLDEVAYITTHPNYLRSDPPETYGSIIKILPRVANFPSYDGCPSKFAYVKANIQCCCSHRSMGLLCEHLRREIPELSFVLPSMKASVIDILPANWSKGDAVQTLIAYLGIASDEVVVFGDSENDLAMMQAVANSVAVANATAQVSRAAAWHIGSCAEGAVDDALREIALAYEQGRLPDFMKEGSR